MAGKFVKDGPKIVLFDIETAPNLSWVWGWYEQNVIDVECPWYILSFAYKFLGEDETYVHALCDYPGYKKDRENDLSLCQDLWKVFDEADVLIGHNSDAFDIKKANARFVAHGFKPPSPYKSVDTLKLAKRNFKFDSNKLGNLGDFLGLGGKVPHTGFSLWRGCMDGDPKAWATMKDYNARDVELLEKVYEQLRPWAVNHPDLSVFHEGPDHICPSCQSTKVQRRGMYVARTRKYQRYACTDCGAWSKGELVKS